MFTNEYHKLEKISGSIISVSSPAKDASIYTSNHFLNSFWEVSFYI